MTGSGVGRPGAQVNWSVAGRIVIGCVLLFFANLRQAVDPDETVSENPTFGPAYRPQPEAVAA